MHSALSSELAEIEWLISSVEYTPENYTVVYGRDQMLLNYTSDVVIGTRNITDTNQMYSVRLTGLEDNTTYYYQVIATNSIGSNSSNVRVFVTPPPSRFFRHYYSNHISIHVLT